MKYQSELINEILEDRGHEKSSLHYESECVESWIEESKGAYPKLCDYQSEWLNYINENSGIGEFPYLALLDVTNAVVENVVPYVSSKDTTVELPSNAMDIVCVEYQDGMENWDIPYFEGMQSVKMPVLTTTGKNLATVSNVRLEGIRNNSGDHPKNIIMKNIPVEEGKTYTISGVGSKSDNMSYILFTRYEHRNPTDSNNHSQLWGEIGRENSNTTFTIPKGIKYVSFTFGNCIYNNNGEDGWLQWDSIQLEEGSTATSYEPFKSNILSTPEEVVLREVNGVRDTLNLMTGEYVQRIKEMVLNGNETYTSVTYTHNNTNLRFDLYLDDIKTTTYDGLLCDKLPVFTREMSQEGGHTKSYIAGHAHSDRLVIIIEKSKLPSEDIEGFKAWLQSNPLTIQYELKTPIIKTVDLTIVDQDGNALSKIKPIEGLMIISTDGTPIKPLLSAEIPVEATTQNLSSFIDLEME